MEVKADQLGDGLFITERVAPSIGLSIKSLNERQNRGFDPSLRKLSVESSLAHCLSEPKFETSQTSSFHLSKL